MTHAFSYWCDAQVHFIPGRIDGSTIAFKGDLGRVIVPGFADAVFSREDAYAHHKSFREPENRNLLSILQVPDLNEYIYSFLQPSERVRVEMIAQWLLDSNVIPIALDKEPRKQLPIVDRCWSCSLDTMHCRVCNGKGDLTQDRVCAWFERSISVDYDGIHAQLQLPERPDIWVHFKLPSKWNIYNPDQQLIAQLHALREMRKAAERAQATRATWAMSPAVQAQAQAQAQRRRSKRKRTPSNPTAQRPASV